MNNGLTEVPDGDIDPRIWLLNQYRAAEVHGAGAIMRMGKLADNSELRSSLSRHLRDEAVHAWLWTRAINDLDGDIISVPEAYQTRLAFHYGIPSTLNDLLALTLASEKRGLAQYIEHMDTPEVTGPIHRTLRAILKDEEWHVRYIKEELDGRAKHDTEVFQLVERALEADRLAVAELQDASAKLTD
ncbi:MAG: ferritin-like domain-containing protein [Actinocatenispora sp.]